MVHPPSIPNLPQFTLLGGILDQGCAWYILQPIVLKNSFGLFSRFSLQAVMCLLQVLILNTFAVGLSFFLMMEICMSVAILDLSHSVFAMDFVPWLSFGCLTTGHPISARSLRLCLVGMDFFIVFESFGLVIVKLLR